MMEGGKEWQLVWFFLKKKEKQKTVFEWSPNISEGGRDGLLEVGKGPDELITEGRANA